jgi:predicted DNA binding CopG/RHH family protein
MNQTTTRKAFKTKKPSKKPTKKQIAAALADADKWDKRELGADAKHARRVSPERDEEIDAAIERGLGLQPITLRLPKNLVEKYKMMAKKRGLSYQPYIRMVLTEHADAEAI